MIYTDKPFSVLLNSLISEYYHANRDLSDKTEQHGQRISVRNIQRYRSSKSVPQFATAKLLIEAAGGDVPADELKRSLELEKQMQKEEEEISENVTVRISNLTMNKKLQQDNFGILDVIKERAEMLYPESSNPMEEYICDLIAKDIYEDIV